MCSGPHSVMAEESYEVCAWRGAGEAENCSTISSRSREEGSFVIYLCQLTGENGKVKGKRTKLQTDTEVTIMDDHSKMKLDSGVGRLIIREVASLITEMDTDIKRREAEMSMTLQY